MAKTVWIVNYYISPPNLATNMRHLEFADALQKKGYNVLIISSSYLRANKLNLIEGNEPYKFVNYDQYKFCHINVISNQGNGIKRMLSIFQFSSRLYFNARKIGNPNIILHNVHPPFDYLISSLAKKIKCTYIAEAWDLWPLDFVTMGLVSKNNPLMKLAYYLERKMYERASEIIFTFAGGIDYLRNRKYTLDRGGVIDMQHVHYINNGISLREFDFNKNKYITEDEDLVNDTKFKIVYLGSIKLANNVFQLIKAAEFLKNDYPKIVIIIYGNGNQRCELMQYCKKNKITNVKFKEERMPFSHVPYVVSCADLNIMNYKMGFGKFGVSSGKLFQYLAAGKPIVCNIEIAYDDVITENILGVSRNFQSVEEYASAIVNIYNLNKQDYMDMCVRARKTAQRFDYEYLSRKIIGIVEKY